MWVEYLAAAFSGTLLANLIVALLPTWLIERLKASLGHRNRTAGYQFEVEYQLYRDIWSALEDAQMAKLRLQMWDLEGDGIPEDPKERTKKKLLDASNKLNVCSEIINRSRPFYPDSVRTHVDELASAIFAEAQLLEWMRTKGNFADRHAEAQKNWESTKSKKEAACCAIRDRINMLRRG